MLFSTVMFSLPSYAKWTMFSEMFNRTYYVDFEGLRKYDEEVYFWFLVEAPTPNSLGQLSTKTYYQVNCRSFGLKALTWSIHKEPMGGGIGEGSGKPDQDWTYPPTNSLNGELLREVCSR